MIGLWFLVVLGARTVAGVICLLEETYGAVCKGFG